MATLSYLTDVIGPRLTGSPNLKRANDWTRDTLAKWGLSNAHLEPWGPFGRGWTLKRFSAQVIEPQCIPLIAFPKAWSPSTDGTLAAPVIYFDAKSEADFAKFKGKVKGAIVLTGPPREVSARFEPLASRKTDKELLDLADAAEPTPFRFDMMGGPPANRAPGGGTECRGPRHDTSGRRGRGRPGRQPASGATDAVRPRDASPDGAGPEEVQVPGRRRRRTPGRLQQPGRGRHPLRLASERPRCPGLPDARARAGGQADLGLGQGRPQDPAPDRRGQGALQPAWSG